MNDWWSTQAIQRACKRTNRKALSNFLFGFPLGTTCIFPRSRMKSWKTSGFNIIVYKQVSLWKALLCMCVGRFLSLKILCEVKGAEVMYLTHDPMVSLWLLRLKEGLEGSALHPVEGGGVFIIFFFLPEVKMCLSWTNFLTIG